MTDYTELIEQLNAAPGLLGKKAADAIKALQAEIAWLSNYNGRLEVYNNLLIKQRDEMKAEIERLNTTVSILSGAGKYAAQQRDALQARLDALEKQDPVAYQFQTLGDGKWHDFIDDKHYRNTVEDGRWPIRALFTAPVAQPAKPEPETVYDIVTAAQRPAKPVELSEQQVDAALTAWYLESSGFSARMKAAILAAKGKAPC